MEIDSRYVGLRSEALAVSLSPRQTMNFAAALGDDNPHYFDEDREGGIWTPPMMAVALTWPLSSQFDRYWPDSAFPVEAQQRQVHYNESITWIRPIRPDEHLSIQGEIVSMRPHPSGTLIAIRYEASGQGGGLAFTETIGGLLRGVTLADGGAGEVPPSAADVAPSGGGWTASVYIDPLAAHVYDGCTDIIFPIHTSVAFAKLVGLPRPIYHGTATLGLAVREILNREAGGDPAALSAVQCGFRGMVFPGSAIEVRVGGVRDGEAEKTVYFDVADERGALAVRGGHVRLRNP